MLFHARLNIHKRYLKDFRISDGGVMRKVVDISVLMCTGESQLPVNLRADSMLCSINGTPLTMKAGGNYILQCTKFVDLLV